MATSVKEMLAAANAVVPKITAAKAREMQAGADALIVDVRDGTEVAKSGKVKGAVAAPRGLIEFRADPESPAHDAAFRKDRPIILYCASGGRSALSGKTLHDMGYTNVHNLGGFKDAVEGGLEVEPA
ncbi:rhodanese-related sulfurtransferase [Stella humosa]|uniref:Rhodanese-related sulfurtransferase n=1 Tax=Stella humosa TaxID=94 RepID=A0A3N1LI38_9PROT|nr:rhodanese-like domain-containing protein [Stella humosa]ROP90884.1 rhodanese-related sulfurtransferase [Stella humosa]BBK34767.1 rhodanese-like domain-containing protein [Stella humosa]